MVVPSPNPVGNEKIKPVGFPTIDLSRKRSQVLELLVKACEEYGFFKVINHGVPKEVIATMEAEGLNFFAQTTSEKQRAGPPNPFGYGIKNIGFNGDTGNVEYLLLHTQPLSISQRARAISEDPVKFCCAVNDYIEAIRDVACEILEMLAEGLRFKDRRTLSKFIKDGESDSVFRLNHYPPIDKEIRVGASPAIGFGEHSDPQILTILRSNDVGGLQISLRDGVWVPVPPDPNSFFVNVGDALQALTNGRFMSVRHRALTNSFKSRMSMVYFGAPPLHAQIQPLAEMVTPHNPCLYRPFTWTEYKKATYSLRLGHSRLDLFRTVVHGEEEDDL